MPWTTPYRLIADDPLPERHRVDPRVAHAADPGVVAQHVRGAEALDRELRQRGDVGLRRGVADPRRDVAAVLGQPRRDLGEPRLVDVGEHHVHALGDERARRAPARSHSPRR